MFEHLVEPKQTLLYLFSLDPLLCEYDTAIKHKPLNLLHFRLVQYSDTNAKVPASLLAF